MESILNKWRYEKDPSAKNELLEELFKEGIFPTSEEFDMFMGADAGLYPDIRDENFVENLMRKQEFHESKQEPIAKKYATKKESCRSTEDFELSSVQRFIGRLLSPNTPYNSALLYHGVGVGKTCAAITVCEAYLEMNPGQKVIIIAPPNIQEGFRRTIFDMDGLTIGTGESSNTHRGCTGNTYLALSGTFKERNKAVIESRIEKVIKSRYDFFGYTSFYNYINNITKAIPKSASAYEQRKRDLIRREFSNRAIIIDEAHNLRDIFAVDLEEEDTKDFVTEGDAADSTAGKRLTPFLRDVLRISEGITLVLMTATPMYNSYTEIIFLINLLLLNDKYPTIQVNDVFNIKAGNGTFTPSGRLLLGKLVSTYISFMRGENPLTFPLRLKPAPDTLLQKWPTYPPKGKDTIPEEESKHALLVLPCQPCPLTMESELVYKEEADSIEGLGITNMDRLIQAGNWLFPGDESIDFSFRIGDRGFDRCFTAVKQTGIVVFKANDGVEWLIGDELKKSSPKCATLLQRLALCRGVAFVYSRFIKSGALTIALALEANGYTLWGNGPSFLIDIPKSPQGRQCALCSRRETGHGMVQEENGTAAHAFKPAKYVLLTGSEDYSPNNTGSINAARATTNLYGADVKVIIGSQVAGEGLDLRYIREVIVYDSWYHLNRLEQVVGRGIRNCSHALLDTTKRNCTIVLLVTTYQTIDRETIDLYSYRQALKKAVVIGNVTRLIKEFAIDCFLNIDANLIKDIPKIPFIYDSQGEKRDGEDHKGISINDKGYTPMCDWMEDCEYTCKKGDGTLMRTTPFLLNEQDISTYDEYAARYHAHTIRKYLRERISKAQVYINFDQLKEEFVTIPPAVLSSILNDIVSESDIKIKTVSADGKDIMGHIIRRGRYYLFQPDLIVDESIPIALRLAHVPIPRDTFAPKQLEYIPPEKEEVGDISKDVKTIWKQILLLTADIERGKIGLSISPELMKGINALPQSKGVSKAQKERMDMMLWMYTVIHTNEAIRKLYAQVLREYIWDEFIPSTIQTELLQAYGMKEADDYVKKVASYSYWLFEGTTYIRLINTNTNAVEFLQIDPTNQTVNPSPTAVQEVLVRERASDPIIKAGIHTRNTGYNYGFIIFNQKVNRLVFKKGKPSESGALSRGSECAKNSTTRFEIQELLHYGQTLLRTKLDTLGLTQEEMAKEGRAVTNSIRVCTLVDLALRMMDAMKVEEKRWFYRPLEAALYGHPLR